MKGVGAETAKRLNAAFGGLRGVRQATLEQLEAVKGISKRTAASVYAHFHDLPEDTAEKRRTGNRILFISNRKESLRALPQAVQGHEDNNRRRARRKALKRFPARIRAPRPNGSRRPCFPPYSSSSATGGVLELFGGCGQLSLEALSRGAESATIVDSSPAACAVIRENAVKTKLAEKCRVICSGWREFVKGMAGQDGIFDAYP